MASLTKTPRELIRAFPFFRGLPEPAYADLLHHAQTRHYAKGEDLFDAGQPCKGLFFVQSGVVKIYKLAENGREQIIHLQYPGDSIAELPVFDHEPYPASAAAMEDADILFIPKAAFEELLARYPQLCQSVITVLAKRMRRLVELVEDLSLRQVRQRLARLLREEAAGRAAFMLTFTNEELAARLGSVRDVVSRTMSALQNDGVIRLTGRHVEILNKKRLEDEAG